MFAEFMSSYGFAILSTIVTALIGYLGIVIKNAYTKYIDTKTKKEIVNTVVNAIEQLKKTKYKTYTNEDLFDKAVENANELLNSKGISTTELEIEMLVESVVNGFKKSIEE